MTNRGKIARLPHEVREQLNLRLRNGENGNKLLEWLNGLPEVQAVLMAEFGGEPISEQNLSRWRQGGYKQWLAEQEAMAGVRRMIKEAGEFAKEAEGQITDRLALWMTMRCALAAEKLAREGGEDGFSGQTFQDLCRAVIALRRGDHYARWIEIERERMEAEKKPDPKKMEKQFKEWAMDPEIKREFFPEQLTEDEKEEAWRQVFGLGPKDKNPYENPRSWRKDIPKENEPDEPCPDGGPAREGPAAPGLEEQAEKPQTSKDFGAAGHEGTKPK